MSAQLDFAALTTCLQSLDHLFIDISRLKPETGYEEQIGGYGTVRVSTLDFGAPGAVLVAAKTIRLKDRHKDPKRLAFRLARELKIWAGFRHPHVLSLMGYYLDKDYRTAVLISRYMIHGDLKEYIDHQKPTWDVRLHLVCDLTDGLAYLHEQTPPVLHGDLKMKNVLVSADRRGMLADFGLSKALEEGPTGLTTSDGLKGTLRCYSPELIRDKDSSHSLPSDIWAWGCLALEALADRIPYAEKKSEHSIIWALMNNEPPSDTESLSLPAPDLKILLGRCWTTQPSERPSAGDCFRVIESVLSTPRSMAGVESVADPRDSLQQGIPSPELGVSAADILLQPSQSVPLHSQQTSELPALPPQLHELFWSAFKRYLDERHIPLELPKLEGKEVELHRLFFTVGALGGWRTVSAGQLWRVVGAQLGLFGSNETLAEAPLAGPALTEGLSVIYQITLADFETCWCTSLRPSDPDATFPLPSELQFLHPEIEKLAQAQSHLRQESYGFLSAKSQHEARVGVMSELSDIPQQLEEHRTALVTDPRANLSGQEGPMLNPPRELVNNATKYGTPASILWFFKKFLDNANGTVSSASQILSDLMVQKRLRRQETGDVQSVLMGECNSLYLTWSELRKYGALEEWAASRGQNAVQPFADIPQVGPHAQLDDDIWGAQFFEIFIQHYRLRHFEYLETLVKAISLLLDELFALQKTAPTIEENGGQQKQDIICNLFPGNEPAIELNELTREGDRRSKFALLVLEMPVAPLESLNKLIDPSWSNSALLFQTENTVVARAGEVQTLAHSMLFPPRERRTQILDALRLVSDTKEGFLFPEVFILADLAPTAARIEKTCSDIISNRYSPQASQKPPFEEIQDIQKTVRKKLWMFAFPTFDVINQQLVQHEAWVEKLPWSQVPELAMQVQRISDDVVQSTRPEHDVPPSDPECTCLCLLPVKVTTRRQADAVKCFDCGARFHSTCIEGSCPFCDHHHWNGALTKTRDFEFADLLPIRSTAPDLTRNYSLDWKHTDIIITSVDRLVKSIDAFLATVPETTINSPPPTTIPQIRHFLRKLYKIQFTVRTHADLPSYGLTLCRLHRSLANNHTSQENGQKLVQRRPRFIFTAEFMPLARDGSRCLCKGNHIGHRLVTCKSCSYNFHDRCVLYDEANNPNPNRWRCPMCITRKGKQYPQSAVRVRAVGEQHSDVYVDTKTCLESYSAQLIRQRLPPPTNLTIVLELERFIPGSNQHPWPSFMTWLPPLTSQPHALLPALVYRDPPRTSAPSSAGSVATSASVSPAPPGNVSSSVGLRAFTPSPLSIAPNAIKRKVPEYPEPENPRRMKPSFREGDGVIGGRTSEVEPSSE